MMFSIQHSHWTAKRCVQFCSKILTGEQKDVSNALEIEALDTLLSNKNIAKTSYTLFDSSIENH